MSNSELLEAAVKLRELLDATRAAARISITSAVLADELEESDFDKIASLYPLWASGTVYGVSDICLFDGVLYKCVQGHTSQNDWEPPTVPALWVTAKQTQGSAPAEFVQPTGSENAYQIGDRVTFQGHVYESLIANNVWAPSAYPQGWNLIS